MFDVGFSELIVIAIVALVVIGPERLPKVARTVGHILGRLQRYVSTVKADVQREMQLDELKKLQEQVAAQAREMESSVNEHLKTVEADLNQAIAPDSVAVEPAPQALAEPSPAEPGAAATTASPAAEPTPRNPA
jgi:sec-independent protein translocase protein TatB